MAAFNLLANFMFDIVNSAIYPIVHFLQSLLMFRLFEFCVLPGVSHSAQKSHYPPANYRAIHL